MRPRQRDRPYAAAERGGWVNRVECSDGAVYPMAVGSYRPNDLGLYDMHGNVSEWTEDCWQASYEDAPTDGRAWLAGDCAKRVQRGGGWSRGAKSVAFRSWSGTGRREMSIGFRVARTLTP